MSAVRPSRVTAAVACSSSATVISPISAPASTESSGELSSSAACTAVSQSSADTALGLQRADEDVLRAVGEAVAELAAVRVARGVDHVLQRPAGVGGVEALGAGLGVLAGRLRLAGRGPSSPSSPPPPHAVSSRRTAASAQARSVRRRRRAGLVESGTMAA